jgi:DNA-binding NtrC family response regulator
VQDDNDGGLRHTSRDATSQLPLEAMTTAGDLGVTDVVLREASVEEANRPKTTQHGPAPDAGSLFVDEFSLTVVEGPERGRTFVTSGDAITIGSHPKADVRLTDPSVSRFHCEIARTKDGKKRLLVRDLSSTNCTILNGVAIQEAYLSDGLLLGLGACLLRFSVKPNAVKLAVSERRRFGLLVGESPAMRAMFAVLEHAASTDSTILIEGETGTGKEVAAESIHLESARRRGPFVVVDCGAIPPNLLESELFGHEKGAFTGAVAARQGAFEAAAGGTIFLDEIGELAPELQPRLLRALERRRVKRVGGNEYVDVDVRIVAATNRDLRSEVTAKRFRSDLYWRLAVFQARLPPLRERLEDLPLLVDELLARMAVSSRQADFARSAEMMTHLARHRWPGNVREVRNHLEQCLAFLEPRPFEQPGHKASASGEAQAPSLSGPFRTAREGYLRTFEKRYLQQLLSRHHGNVAEAHRESGLARSYFYRLLERAGVR